MELAINMFTGGMVLDSHPLVQSSDTLSDALNATYITMNGNEVVLQNDMGNRRVDNAYLPAGYEPVGIKEHGGIIYIAAYNPITHRGQIGSFPSPERNMGVEYKDNGTSFNLTDFISENNIITINGVKFLKNDILLYPLTKDTSLHAGDKFTVYSGDVWAWGDRLLTNFGTEDNNGFHKYNKIPFNSYFTLSLGVMNSLNEFSDITSSLERFDSTGNIIKGLDSDEDKFNTGYFIAPDNWKNVSGLTNNDSTLINVREKIGANTYVYKLTGPLYLKAELNHILTFSYSINMSKNQSNINLYITGTAVYNCPDSNEEELPYFDSFKLLFKNSDNEYLTISGSNFSKEPRIYDLTTGLYTSTIIKLFTIDESSLLNFVSGNLLNYLIAVPLFHSTNGEGILSQNIEDEQIYLNNLSETGTIDISKIGTNECELNMWRYKNIIEDNQVTSTILDYKFDCYNDLATTFKDLKIKLINQTSNLDPFFLNDIISIPDKISSGRQEFLIDWTSVEEEKRINFLDLYLAEITYKLYSTLEQLEQSSITIYRFILGTKLFNSCYEESHKDYTSDFGIFMGIEDDNGYYKYNNTIITTASEEKNKIRDNYLNVWDKITIAEDPVLYSTLSSKTENGKIISKTQPSNTYVELQNKYNIEIKYNTDWKIEDKDLLIKNTEIINSSTKVSTSLSEINTDKETNIIKTLDLEDNELNILNDIVFIPLNQITNNISTNVISFPITLSDRIYIGYKEETKFIGKAYVLINDSNFLEDIYKLMSANLKYFCIGTEGHLVGGYVGYVNSDSIYGGDTFYEEPRSHDIYGNLGYVATIPIKLFNNYDWFDDYNYKPSDAYDTLIKPFFKNIKCPFTFGFSSSNDNDSDPYYLSNNYYASLDDPNWIELAYNDTRHFWITRNITKYSGKYYTRVWWIDDDGNPCLLNNSDNNTMDSHHVKGLFGGWPYSSENMERNDIYEEILDFIGKIKIGNTLYNLILPLENYPYKAYYINSDSYLYSEDTKINLRININHKLQVNLNTELRYNGNQNSCLKFYINPGELLNYKNIKREVSKNYKLGEYSLKVFDFALLLDLSSYGIYLDDGTILTENDPLKHLYIRKFASNKATFKEIPKTYPIQINQGTYTKFPIVCRKKYNSYKNKISNSLMINPIYYTDGDSISYQGWINNTVRNNYGYTDENILWSRVNVELDPSTKDIPVLYEEDLTLPDNFFDT